MKTRIDMTVVLPDVDDVNDECVHRLQALVGDLDGISGVHVIKAESGSAQLCLHYNPSVVSLVQVQRMAAKVGADLGSVYGHSVLPLHAVTGEDAARRIEKNLESQPGILSAVVNLPAQVARVEWEKSTISEETILKFLRKQNYATGDSHVHGIGCRGHAKSTSDGTEAWFQRNRELAWSIASGALLAVAWVTESLQLGGISIALYLAAYGCGAFDLITHSIRSILKGHFTFDIDFLMLLAAIGSAILGAWVEGGLLLFLFSLAHALEHYALDRARGAIRALSDLAPPRARVLRDGKETEILVEEVKIKDIVVILPAERVPVDGVIVAGASSLNQASITGESIPVDKKQGDEVFAGTINGEGALQVETTKASGDRTLDRVIELVEEAQTHKAPTQLLTERFERIFVPSVLIADVLLIVLLPLFGVLDWATSFYRGMALLVAASPCALALGTPSAVLAAIAQAARKGVLIKGGAHLENLGILKAMAFDKTGTLTVGKPEVTDVVPAEGATHDELLTITAAVEQRSQHPLAQAIVRRAEGLKLPEAGDLESVTGRGVRSTVENQIVGIGNVALWRGENIPQQITSTVSELQAGGKSIMIAKHGEKWLGVIGLADRPRTSVRAVLDSLRSLELGPLVMLTGDNRGVGEAIGREVGVDEVKADLLPEHKVAAIKDLISQHGSVGMVGDGVNDAPALAHATVGIAMGGAGTAAALETADVALMSDDLSKLSFAVALSRATRSVIRQNLYLSFLVIGALIVTTATGILGIAPAVALHEGSTLVVIANSLRLLAFSKYLDVA